MTRTAGERRASQPGDRVHPVPTEPAAGRVRTHQPRWPIALAAATVGLIVGLLAGGEVTVSPGDTATTVPPTSAAPTTTTSTSPSTTTTVPFDLPDAFTAPSVLGTIEWTPYDLSDEYLPWQPVATGIGFLGRYGTISSDGIHWAILDVPGSCPEDRVTVMTHRGLVAVGTTPTRQDSGIFLRRPGACLLGPDWSWTTLTIDGDPDPDVGLQWATTASIDHVTVLTSGSAMWVLGDDGGFEPVIDPPFRPVGGWGPAGSLVSDGDRFLAVGFSPPETVTPAYALWSSTDGRTWLPAASPPDLDEFASQPLIFRSGGRPLAVVTRSGAADRFFVLDGDTWTEVADPPATLYPQYPLVAAGDAGFMALSLAGTESGPRAADGWISADGWTWEALPERLFEPVAGGADDYPIVWDAVVGHDTIVLYLTYRQTGGVVAWAGTISR